MNNRLEELESIIAPNLDAALKVGLCFLEIRQNKLYRPAFKSFGAYVVQRWQFSRAYIYPVMNAAQTLENLSTVVDKNVLPESIFGLNKLQKALNGTPPNVVLKVVQIAANVARELHPDGKITPPVVKALESTLEAVTRASAIDDTEGGQIALSEAFTAHLYDDMRERMERNKQYMRDALDRKHGKSSKLFEITTGNFTYSYSRIELQWEIDNQTAKRLSMGKAFRFVVYELEDELEHDTQTQE